LIANENAYLGDIFSSGPSNLPHTQPCPDSSKPITCGLYRLEAGTPLVYQYTYHEMKIIVDGEFEISDETGQVVKGRKGDVFYFPKGSKITFKTESFGVGFFVGQRMVSFLFFPWGGGLGLVEMGRVRAGGWRVSFLIDSTLNRREPC
jgi:uncharacterized cupin superfamily protein